MGVVKDCYAHFGMELSAEAEGCMRRFLDGRGSGHQNAKFGKARAQSGGARAPNGGKRGAQAGQARRRTRLAARAAGLRARCSNAPAPEPSRPLPSPPHPSARPPAPPRPQVSTQEHADFLKVVGLSTEEVAERLRIAALPPAQAAAARARAEADGLYTPRELPPEAEGEAPRAPRAGVAPAAGAAEGNGRGHEQPNEKAAPAAGAEGGVTKRVTRSGGGEPAGGRS